MELWKDLTDYLIDPLDGLGYVYTAMDGVLVRAG